MPRVPEPEEEDMLATCPRCRGEGRIYRLDLDATAPCPVCDAAGRVTQAVYERYTNGLG